MIKVYVDWGVMSQLKHGHHAALLPYLDRKHQLMVYYSTSHISDILVSYKENDDEQAARIKEDLDYITRLTDNWCIHTAEKQIAVRQIDPHELFEDQVEQQKGYGTEGPLVYLLSMTESNSLERQLLELYMNLPMPSDMFKVYDDPRSAERMREHYPGLEENPTIGNLISMFWSRNKVMNETDAYKDLRLEVQQGLKINKDKMFATPDPFNAMGKAYGQIQELTGFDINKAMRNDQSPEWFQDISHNYMLLDIHGFQQDKIKVDEKNRETMRNTIDDGFHSAFASTCDFYITNDTRSANKAKEVYKKLNINTRICSPAEFVAYANDSLAYDEPGKHLLLWMRLLATEDYHETVTEEATWRTFFTEFFFFDYFNKVVMTYFNDEPVPTIYLTKIKPTNYRYISTNDVINVILKLNVAFCAEKPVIVNHADIDLTKSFTYRWVYQGYDFRLHFLNGYLQLYLDLPDKI